MPPQLVLEIKRFKIAKDVWSTSKSRRIVAFAEGSYHGKIVKSVDSKVYTGTKLCLPWNDTLQKLQINFYFIDDLLTIDIGTALYAISDDGKFGQETASTEVLLKIYPVGAVVPVGRALVSISVQEMFDDENTGAHKCAVPKQTAIDHDFAVPGFRFKRLSRVLHWERIRSMNLSQTVQNGDVRTLLTCLDDVTCGDASQEDVDPQLYKALQMAQYGSQYLLSCRKVMKDREAVLKAALKAFQQEEDVLDLKLAKLRARDKALQREARDLDDLTVEYSSALKEVNPRLINTLYKTYQEKVRIPSTGQLVEMADNRQLNYEDEYDRNSSDDNHRHHSHRRESHRHQDGYQSHSRSRFGKQRGAEWEEAPPVSEQMNLQPREPHVFDVNAALGPRRTLRHPQVGSSRQIGDPWASADSRDNYARGAKGHSKSEGAVWAHQRHVEDFESENAYRNTDENVSSGQQPTASGWKTSTVASVREIPTGHTVPTSLPARTIIDRSQQQGWAEEQQVQTVSDDENSESESDVRENAGGLKRVVSRNEFAGTTVQPVLRSLSVRSINVNAETAHSVTRNEVSDAKTGNSASDMAGPRPSASINVARDGWSGAPLHNNPERSLASTARPAQPFVVQQSTGEMSAATAMSVDSLNPRMTHVQTSNMQDKIAVRDHHNRSNERFRQNDRSFDDGRMSNNESYENIDMSSFVHPSHDNSTSQLSHTGERDVRGISQRDESNMSIEDYIANDLREAEREQQLRHQGLQQEQEPPRSLHHTLNSTNDSVMVEEFDDSLHMDHRPISGFTSSDPNFQDDSQLVKQQVRLSGSATPGRAPLLPPSASKSTPKRPERDEVFSPGEYEYSMSHDSPFPDLSGGKHFNRQQARNQSHISSNASNSRNYNDRSGMSQHTGGSDSYDLDAFEEEDEDPFGGRGSSGPKRTLDLTNITGGSTDIDASKSITIDFVLPSESKDLHRHAPLRASEGAKSQLGGRSYPYEEPDISGEIDLFSPLGGPQSHGGQFGSTHGAGPRGAVRDEDDDVLMGTTKLSSGTRDFGNFSNTFQSRGTASDRFEQDSLGGTFNSNTTGHKVTSFSPMTAPTGPGSEAEEEEEESIPPPTYDSMIGTGNTEDSNASRSQLRHSQEDVSSYLEVSADAPSAHAPHHLHMHAVQTEVQAAGIVAPTWQLGRAPVDAIELATAFDVFVSAVQLDAQHARIYSEIQIKVEFLGIMSPLSGVVDLSRTQSVQPVSFSTHLVFSPEQEELLQQEIAELDDAIACQIHVLDAVTQEIVGTANVQLWVMVEDSVNILRQEVEVLNLDMSSDMGSALVDVKGFRLLKKCANAQRQRRTGH